MKRILWMPLCLLLCLSLCTGAQAKISAIELKYAKATLKAGKSATMPIQVKPAAERGNVVWESSNESVATVTQSGKISAIKAGTAVITASAAGATGAAGGVSARCQLTVKPAAVTKVTLDQTQVTVALGAEPVQLSASVAPAAAAGSALKWSSSNKKVATVTSAGRVTFKGAGSAKITATAPSGKKAVCTVKVASASSVRRAVVIGESRASAVLGLTALPMVPDEVSSVAATFKARGIKTTSAINTTRAKVLSAIETAFASAGPSDVSYVYITCHGGLFGGAYRMYPCGDGYITPSQLRAALDKVPGKVVLMLGACYSGTVINKGEDAQRDTAQAFIDAFVGATAKSGEFKDDKYLVLCAASGSEKGYGVLTTDAGGTMIPSQSYNFFGKAVVEGGGGQADANGDGRITLGELHAFAYRRVNELHAYWKSKIGLSALDTQTVVCYPTGSGFVVFN